MSTQVHTHKTPEPHQCGQDKPRNSVSFAMEKGILGSCAYHEFIALFCSRITTHQKALSPSSCLQSAHLVTEVACISTAASQIFDLLISLYNVLLILSHWYLLEWVPIPFSKGSSQPRDQTQVSCIAGGFVTIWSTREAQFIPTLPYPLVTMSLFSTSVTLLLFCKKVYLYTFFRFHI